MVIPGQDLFNNGMRVSMNPKFDDGSWEGVIKEVPRHGYDITMGEGVFIGAGAIIIGDTRKQ